MANWSNPTLTSTYTNFVTEVKDRDTDCATLFDGSSSTNLPTGTKRWNATSNKFEKWSGSAWSDLSSGYAITITGNAANITGVAAAANGGTGQSSYAVGDLLYASATTTVSKLADVATGNALLSGGVGVAPFYGKVGLTTHVSGTLPVANGGTGVTSSTGSGSVVLSTAPTFTTSITAPLLIGGTGTTATLILRATSGAGTTGADIVLQTGNNGATEVARFLNNGNLGVGTASPSGKLHLAATNAAQVFRVDESTSLYTCTQGLDDTGLYVKVDSGSRGFRWIANTTERMRIDTSGNLLIGTTTAGIGNNIGTTIETSGLDNARITVNHSSTGSSNGSNYLQFGYGGTLIGSVSQNSITSVSYNTSSDYRLKDNIQPMTNALNRNARLKPVTYTWRANGCAGEGFIAHELQEFFADAVTGHKDAVDQDGNPIYQGIDTSFLVGHLVACIQELKAEVDALKDQCRQLAAADHA